MQNSPITAAAVLLVIGVVVFFIFDFDERVKSAPMSITTNTGSRQGSCLYKGYGKI